MTLFQQGNRKNPTKPLEKNKIKSFISFKKKPKTGEFQEAKLVYTIKKKKDILYNYIYVFNPYTIGLSKVNDLGEPETVTGAMILQSIDNNLYLVPTQDGRTVRSTRTISYFEMRTFLHYVPKLNELCNYNEINEHLFRVNENLIEFEANNIGVNNIEFKGYRLEFIKSLHNKDIKDEKPLEITDIDEINDIDEILISQNKEEFKLDDNISEDLEDLL